MKLGVFTPVLADRSLDDALNYLSRLGISAVEIGCGGFPGTAHANAGELILDSKKLEEFKKTVSYYNMIISALSVHGNPVHPNKDIAAGYHNDFIACCKLAEKLGIDTVITFSGCPGDGPNAVYPNWVTCPWPDDFSKLLEWQWNEVLIPYWQSAVKIAGEFGIKKIALEMHPGFCVYNPETLLRLRNAVGEAIGANFDPSHLFWQGIDPVAAIRALTGCIYHFHAKDTKIETENCRINGVLDTKHYSDERNRSWLFRTVGYGNDEQTWRNICSELRLCGYDYVMSIEHEDSLMTSKEGLEKAIEFLKKVMLLEAKPDSIWWA